MNGLMLHCGAFNVPLDSVLAVETPPPTATRQPIPHARLLEQVREILAANKLETANEAHALTHDGQRYFGLLDIKPDKFSAEQGWVVGLRNSHDASWAAGMVAGSRVFVCDNLCFSGEVSFGRKHTRYVERDLPGLISAAVGKLGTLWRGQDERIEAYKACELSDRDAHDLIVRAVDTTAVQPSQIIPLLKEWRKPQHEEFEPRNAWSLFNCVTEIQKGTAIWKRPRAGYALHGLLDNYAGLAPIITQIENGNLGEEVLLEVAL